MVRFLYTPHAIRKFTYIKHVNNIIDPKQCIFSLARSCSANSHIVSHRNYCYISHNGPLAFVSCCETLNEAPEVRPSKGFITQLFELDAPQSPISIFIGRPLEELHEEALCMLSDMRRETLELCPTVTNNPNTSQMCWIEKQLSNITYAHKNAHSPQQLVHGMSYPSALTSKSKNVTTTERTSFFHKMLKPPSKKHYACHRTLCNVAKAFLRIPLHI